MEEKKKSNKKIAIGAAALVVLVAAFAIIYFVFGPKATAGKKHITIEVVDDAAETVSYEVDTDAEYLRQAMDEAEGLTYDGTESDYGLMIETVNGLYADYAADGAYWSIFVDGTYGEYGVDKQPVEDGVTYQFVYTIAE